MLDRTEIQELKNNLDSIAVFRDIFKAEPMRNFRTFVSTYDQKYSLNTVYAEFVNSLAPYGYSFSSFLKRAVFEDENRYITDTASGHALPAFVERNVNNELEILSRLTRLSRDDFFEAGDGYIPEFGNTETDLKAEYAARVKDITRYGFGIFATASMFKLRDGEIVPVEHPDTISLSHFVGYENERNLLLENTRALMSRQGASNALLYGDAGTGKSSTVKACANEFAKDGLKLIELRKDQLLSLPYVMGKISESPLCFIIFIDDLSFSGNDDSFSMMKAVLEGSANSRAQNCVIYATSNRRHIVKENFRDRGDDIHHNDTVQELISLSDRFGLTIYFERPDKAGYLDIVRVLAERKGVVMDDAELSRRAEAFALSKSGRSPRIAEQFVSSLLIS